MATWNIYISAGLPVTKTSQTPDSGDATIYISAGLTPEEQEDTEVFKSFWATNATQIVQL